MRGFPLLQLVLIVVAVLLAGLPVYRLTRPATAVAAPAPVPTPLAEPTLSTSPQGAPLEVEAVFAPAPTDFQIKDLDQTVLAGRGPQARFTARWAGKVPPDGADLVVEAHWPVSVGTDTGAAPAAAKFTVRFPDGRSVEKSYWADAAGALTDVLTLPGTTSSQDTP